MLSPWMRSGTMRFLKTRRTLLASGHVDVERARPRTERTVPHRIVLQGQQMAPRPVAEPELTLGAHRSLLVRHRARSTAPSLRNIRLTVLTAGRRS
jgi:hypothetical protein